MWEEWRKASDKFPNFVHDRWGPSNTVDISRNLSKFAKIDQNCQNSSPESDKMDVVKKRGVPLPPPQGEGQGGDVGGHLIDEREVLSVLFKQVEDMGEDSGDEEDNIFNELEFRSDKRRTEGEQTEGQMDNRTGREVCGYCEQVCFCSVGQRVKRPYVVTMTQNYPIDASVPPRNDHYQLIEFRNEALNTIAKLCSDKLSGHSDNHSTRIVKENYNVRAQKLVSSISETFELAEKVRSSCNRRDWNNQVWSGEQCREMLSMESMQDLFQANYLSPYEGEDRQATINSFASNKRKRNQSSSNSFMTKRFLENY
jgi:hypothetical protein